MHVNVRVHAETFGEVVDLLRQEYEVAQAHNWTATYASFSSSKYELPLGVQVTVIGSNDDFLLGLREIMRAEREVLREYNERQLRAAPQGAAAYQNAKNDFLRELVRKRFRHFAVSDG